MGDFNKIDHEGGINFTQHVEGVYSLTERLCGGKIMNESQTKPSKMDINTVSERSVEYRARTSHSSSASLKSSNVSHLVEWARLFDEDSDDQSSLVSVTDAGEDDDESFNECDDEEDQEETRIAQVLVKAAYSGVSTPALDRLLGRTPNLKRKVATDNESNQYNYQMSPSKRQCVAVHEYSTANRSSFLKSMLSMQNPLRVTSNCDPKDDAAKSSDTDVPRIKEEKPDDHLRAKLTQSYGKNPKLVPSSTIQDYFVEQTPQSVEAYDVELAQALRSENVNHLRSLHKAGKTMQCGNKFGETIIHAACRRGAVDVLKFLIGECQVSVKVCCDSGRTPLHDACWTVEPNFTLIDILLDECPDLLYITDKRGFTPMAYVRKEHWAEWCSFLDRRGADKLKPRELM